VVGLVVLAVLLGFFMTRDRGGGQGPTVMPPSSPSTSITPQLTHPTPQPTYDVSSAPDGSLLATDGSTGLHVVDTMSDVTVVTTDDLGETLVVKADGTVWAWGSNKFGALGVGDTTYVSQPQRVNLDDVVAVVTKVGTTYALTGDGEVWGWGASLAGTAEYLSHSVTPLQIVGLPPIKQIAEGSGVAYGLDGDGRIWAWGDILSVLEGMGNPDDPLSQWGDVPSSIPGISGAVQIAASYNGGVALLGDGTVWTWGTGDFGEIGDGTTSTNKTPVQVPGLPSVVAIAKGESTTYALASDGTVWCWGFNLFGQCGTGENPTSQTSPGAMHLSPVQIPGLSGVSQIASNTQMAYAWTADGVYAWGDGALMNLMDWHYTPGANGIASPTLVSALPPVKSIVDGQDTYLITGAP